MGFHLPFVKPFYMSDDNFLAAGYQLFFYEVDSETAKPTYQDFDLTIPNTNPIILDAAGRFNCFLLTGPYKAVLKTPVSQGSATVWTQPKLSGLGSDSLSIVNTIEELESLAPAAANQVLVLGYYFPGDGGGGLFLWNGASTDVDNGGIFIQPDILPATGRWSRSFTGPTNLLWFGAKADGATTDSDAFQRAIAYAVVSGLGNGEIEITTRGAAAEPPVEAAYYFGTVVAGLNGSGFRLTIHKNAQLNFNLAQEIGGSLNAGPYRWVSSLSAAVTFGAQCKLEQGAYPEWWGGLGDDTFDNINVFVALFASAPGRMVFLKGNYATSGGIAGIPAGTIIEAIGQVEDMIEAILIPTGLQVKGAGTLIKGNDVESVDNVTAGNNLIATNNVEAGFHVLAQQDIRAGLSAGGGFLQAQAGTSTINFRAGGRLFRYNNATGIITAGGIATNLVSATLKTGTLLNVGDAIRVRGGGTSTSNGTVTVAVFIGATSVFSQLIDLFQATDWVFEVEITLTDTGKVTALGWFAFCDATGPTPNPTGVKQGVETAVTLTGDPLIQIKGTSSSNNFTQKTMSVDFIPAPI